MTTLAISGQLGVATPFGELLGSSYAEMNAEFADYAKLGVDWVRTDFWWGLAQPSANGGYNWTQIDKVVNAASAHGIKVVGLLNGGPAWGGSGMSSTNDQQAFGKFAGAAAAHFGDKVNHWEILNEENMAGITPANYTKTLQSAYTAIKAVDASDTVITGGTAAVPNTGNGLYGAVDYLKQMYADGAKGYFDAVGYHPYSYPLMPNDPAAWNGWQMMEDGMRQTMVANGDGGKQIWMTEFGAPTQGGGGAVSQSAQAQMIQQATDMAHSTSWSGPIMWYSYKDRGGSTTDTENWFGLVGPNGEHKAAYATYQNIATHDNGTTDPLPPIAPPPTGTPTFSGTTYYGNASDNTIIGNDLNNIIYGSGGSDTIKGGAGNDRIQGDAGNDVLTGGTGNDVFDFNSPKTDGWDVIKDFQAGDKIDLAGIDANVNLSGNQGFKFVGSNWLAHAGDLGSYQDKAGGMTYVEGDTNGDGHFDFSIAVVGVHTFAASDFVL